MVGADAFRAKLVTLTGLTGPVIDLYYTFLGSQGFSTPSAVDRTKQFADAHGILPSGVRDYIMTL